MGVGLRSTRAIRRRSGRKTQGASARRDSRLGTAEVLGSPKPVGTAIAVTSGNAAVGHSSEPDDVVVFELDGDVPRVTHEARP